MFISIFDVKGREINRINLLFKEKKCIILKILPIDMKIIPIDRKDFSRFDAICH